MVKNQGAFRIMALFAFETVKSKREEQQKSMTSRLSFSNF